MLVGAGAVVGRLSPMGGSSSLGLVLGLGRRAIVGRARLLADECPAYSWCPILVYPAYRVTPWSTLRHVCPPVGAYRRAMVIDREWDEPVYMQGAGILRGQIEAGKIEARRPVPSIRTLCQTYGIARTTAAKSLRVLADEVLIRQVPGRGWFVVP